MICPPLLRHDDETGLRAAITREAKDDQGTDAADRAGFGGVARWNGNRLYFSDWSAGEVVAVDLDGQSEVIASVDSLPLCTAWLPDGRLVIVSSADGLLLRREPDGSLVTHADLGQPGWNDIVIDGRGNAYVNPAGTPPLPWG